MALCKCGNSVHTDNQNGGLIMKEWIYKTGLIIMKAGGYVCNFARKKGYVPDNHVGTVDDWEEDSCGTL